MNLFSIHRHANKYNYTVISLKKFAVQKNLFFPYTILLYLSLLLCIVCSGCSEKESSSSSSSNTAISEQTGTTDINQKGTRDNTPIILTPSASGKTVHTCESAILDVSHIEEGYIMADYIGENEKVKLQIKGPNAITYTYNLHTNGFEVFPLTAGDGDYTIGIYENISDTKYSTVLTTSINVVLTNPLGPYLYPNQYVNFEASSLPISKAAELAYSANTDLDVVEQVYNYMIEAFTYDYDKAASVVSGYLPVIDDVYEAKTGICFDYAAVMASMLRSQNIPTRLEVGYIGDQYHAWISIYLEDNGWLNGIIAFDGSNWNLLDPTYASSSKKPKDFITENNKYLTKYVY